jgi:hypothetical protein
VYKQRRRRDSLVVFPTVAAEALSHLGLPATALGHLKGIEVYVHAHSPIATRIQLVLVQAQCLLAALDREPRNGRGLDMDLVLRMLEKAEAWCEKVGSALQLVSFTFMRPQCISRRMVFAATFGTFSTRRSVAMGTACTCSSTGRGCCMRPGTRRGVTRARPSSARVTSDTHRRRPSGKQHGAQHSPTRLLCDSLMVQNVLKYRTRKNLQDIPQ